MDKNDALELFSEIIKNSHDSKGETPNSKTPSDISKVIFEQLVDSEVLNLKIFFYSSSRSDNNKPYTYCEKISREDLNHVLDAKVVLLDSKKSDGLLNRVKNRTTVDEKTSTVVTDNGKDIVTKLDKEQEKGFDLELWDKIDTDNNDIKDDDIF